MLIFEGIFTLKWRMVATFIKTSATSSKKLDSQTKYEKFKILQKLWINLVTLHRLCFTVIA